MDPHAMDLYGAALLAYLDGDVDSELVFRRDDGHEGRLPVRAFFRSPDAFTPLEAAALESCSGHVLDVGAGTGLHSLALQARDVAVTALDVSPAAVEVMTRRGVRHVWRADVFALERQRFDTVLMLGHGIGLVETIEGLDRFLGRARDLLNDGGQVLLDSMDVRATDDPANLAYHEANRRSGRYVGEIRMQTVWRDVAGDVYGWLHVDAETLAERAARAGWHCAVVIEGEHGDYLARLT
jgi:SAM-dependent methyltransferase